MSGATGAQSFWALFCAGSKRFLKSPGVVMALVIALALMVVPGVLLAGLLSLQGSSGPVSGREVVGPSGEAVKDEFMFMHRSLVGDGTITVRVVSMRGVITYPPPNNNTIVTGVIPWAKAGIIMKSDLAQGSSYAAMMVTGGHGVRMQYNFTGDAAGYARGVSPRQPIWLRLTRSGDRFSGYESTTGTRWTRLRTVRLADMPYTLQVGLFVTSPHDLTVSEGASRFTNATAVFDHVALHGKVSRTWTSVDLGAPKGLPTHLYGRVGTLGGRFSVTGSGDIAPLGLGSGWPIERGLMGTFATLSAVIAAVAAFGADETKKAAGDREPRRFARVKTLAAQSLMIGAAGFAVGGLGAIVAGPLSDHLLRSSGNTVLPVPLPTELRVILGTALLVALAGVFTLGMSRLIRRRGATLTVGIAAVVVPYILARMTVVPFDASQWLLRVTPAAGFAMQQSLPAYAQATVPNTPQLGYYPLAPWSGLAVTGAYAVAALCAAAVLSHRARARRASEEAMSLSR